MRKNRKIVVAGAALIVAAAILLSSALSTAQAAEQPLSAADGALAENAAALHGKQPGHKFNAGALAAARLPPRTDTLTVTIAPGKGAQVTTLVDAGQGFVFQWAATGELQADMLGDPADASGSATIYDVGANRRQASGTLVAPFVGKHGWHWQNNGRDHVTVKVVVTGFQKDLLRAVNQ